MNRQESHRIYLQIFAPEGTPESHRSGGGGGYSKVSSASTLPSREPPVPIFHRQNSQEIQPSDHAGALTGLSLTSYSFSASLGASLVGAGQGERMNAVANSSNSSHYPDHPQQQQQQQSSPLGLPHGVNSMSKNKLAFYPSTTTTSAAVRLTDRAKACDVTSLLRGKFGLPSNSDQGNHASYSPRGTNSSSSKGSKSMAARLGWRSGGSSQSSHYNSHHATHSKTIEVPHTEPHVDALVLVGTIEGPPRGYIRFEHEGFLEEQIRLEAFRQLGIDSRKPSGFMGERVNQTKDSELLPTTDILETSHTSGAALDARATASSFEGQGQLVFPQFDPVNDSAGKRNGSDINSIKLKSSNASVNAIHMNGQSSLGKTLLRGERRVGQGPPSTEMTTPESEAKGSKQIPFRYERDSDPIHVLRTVLPHEHPLQVRDEIMAILVQMKTKAEEEMGMRHSREGNSLGVGEPSQLPRQTHTKYFANANQTTAKPTFRWYFQPCSPLGGSGPSANNTSIQSIPAFIDLEGYCTGIEEESDSDGDDESDNDEDTGDNEQIQTSPITLSPQMYQFSKERKRIAAIRQLSDSMFLVSGYLLKQSKLDPNVWRRVYCILSDDRMWVVGRMRSLKKEIKKRQTGQMRQYGVNIENGKLADSMLSHLRVGRHTYIKLHRSLLTAGGNDASSLQQPNNSTSSATAPTSTNISSSFSTFLTPLGRRLPNSFRICTARGTCHTFRAFSSASQRVWVTSLSEKIIQTQGDGLMHLANLIAEEETVARCRRVEDVAVTPLLQRLDGAECAESLKRVTWIESNGSTEGGIKKVTMAIVRFGMSVAEYRELCRHIDDAVRPYKNHGMVVNVRTKVRPTSNILSKRPASGGNAAALSGTTNANMSASQRAKNEERIGMVSAVWEDARIVASNSAQLLHELAALQHDLLKHEEKEMLGERDAENTLSIASNESEPVETQEGKSESYLMSTLGSKNDENDENDECQRYKEKLENLDEKIHTEKVGNLTSLMDELLKEQKDIQKMLGERWDSIRIASQSTQAVTGKNKDAAYFNDLSDTHASSPLDVLALPPLQMFDSLLKQLQNISVIMCSIEQ